MKVQAFAALIPCALLVACSHSQPAPPAPEPNATPPATTSQSTPTVAPHVAPTTMPSAAAFVTLAGAASKTNDAERANAIGGNLQLAAVGNVVQLRGQISGLTPNSRHGFHIHQIGDCSAPDLKSAGERFDPDATPGAPDSAMHHLGDLPVLKADRKGVAHVKTTIAGATLNDGGPHDLMGKALVVHARPDDHKTQSSGNADERIACGVITALP